MPKFEIQQFELHSRKYRVEAETEAEAIKALYEGAAEIVEEVPEYIEVAEDFGLPVDEHPQLARQLSKLGIVVGEAVIPSIRSIEMIV